MYDILLDCVHFYCWSCTFFFCIIFVFLIFPHLSMYIFSPVHVHFSSVFVHFLINVCKFSCQCVCIFQLICFLSFCVHFLVSMCTFSSWYIFYKCVYIFLPICVYLAISLCTLSHQYVSFFARMFTSISLCMSISCVYLSVVHIYQFVYIYQLCISISL